MAILGRSRATLLNGGDSYMQNKMTYTISWAENDSQKNHNSNSILNQFISKEWSHHKGWFILETWPKFTLHQLPRNLKCYEYKLTAEQLCIFFQASPTQPSHNQLCREYLEKHVVSLVRDYHTIELLLHGFDVQYIMW